MSKYNAIVLIILFSLIACKEENKRVQKQIKLSYSNKDFQFDFLPTKTKTIPIDNSSLYYSFINQIYIENNDTFLVRVNQANNTLQFFDWVNEFHEFDIKFPRTGPNGINTISGFYVVNLDSIFVTGQYTNRLKLTDTSAKILTTFFLDKNKLGEDHSLYRLEFRIDNRCPLVNADDKLYISVHELRNVFKPFSNVENRIIELAFDLNNKYSIPVNIKYPKYYEGKLWSSLSSIISRTFNKYSNELIYSFAVDHNIYTFDINTSETKSYFAKSMYFPSVFNQFTKNSESESTKYELESPYYTQLIYDQYNKVYYRFCLQGIEYNPENINWLIMLDRKMSIIVLDSDFNILCETVPFNKKYFFYDNFISEEGLWISNNHPNNKNFNENQLSYTLFKLIKK